MTADYLQTLLQYHLANDAAAVRNLPSTLSVLSSQNFEGSSHLTKWTSRVNALIHSREQGARWAGIVLALQTSRLSRNTMLTSAQAWVTIVLPMLSKTESTLILKAGIRLLSYIFTTTVNLAEFQRHVVTPNVPKLSSALISLIEKQAEGELKVLCLETLSIIVPSYPTLHRSLIAALSTLSLSFLNGSPTAPTPSSIVESASKLHACLHTIGGKVGGAALWRKGVDDAIAFCSTAVNALRTTYIADDQRLPSHADPLIFISLNLDRLRCGVALLCHLLRATVSRPVSVPVKSLVDLCVELIKVSEKSIQPHDFDPLLREMEASAVTSILELGCRLTSCLSRCVQHSLAPHFNRIFFIVAYQLEQPTHPSQRLPFVKILPSLIGPCLPPSDPLIAGRVVKAILPSVAALLSQKASGGEPASAVDNGGKNGKKRARGYEGDELFNVGRSLLCESSVEGEIILATLHALPYLLRIPNLPGYLHSISSRLLLSLLILLPKLPASSVSQDSKLKDDIVYRVKDACIETSSGSSGMLCKSLPLIIDSVMNVESIYNNTEIGSNRNPLFIDLMLHPRIPPLLRPLPSLDAVALTSSDEGTDEQATRIKLGLHNMNDSMELKTTGPSPLISVQQPANAAPIEIFTHTQAQVEQSVVLPDVPVNDAAMSSLAQVTAHTSAPPQMHPDSCSSNALKIDQAGLSGGGHEEEPADRLAPHLIQMKSRPSHHPEPVRMVPDDEDEEDFEMPVINMESDTESEAE
ncbi:hypothetical protein EW145_g134 [Phellinidium pouzarii]|uniref:Pre-rRNA-processing protein RIX1 n=1 Tax=Phellinidium pouzarii TaxID=167371 RepID=A0A4S4LJH8_9AGAM|nr:hypothetical protein EW145_g134 [Phellinidium pouzarii]